MNNKITDSINLPDAPRVPGLVFRHLQSDDDWPGLADAFTRSEATDGFDHVQTAETLSQHYRNQSHFDLYKDLLLAEIHGRIAGYTRVQWNDEVGTGRVYWYIVIVGPEARGKGIEAALLHWAQNRLCEVASASPVDAGVQRLLSTRASDTNAGLQELLKSEGYKPVQFGYEMARSLAEAIPDAQLPEGLEVRPAKPEDYRAIWAATHEAFRDHWGYVEPQEDDYERRMQSPFFQPQLWQVAWDGDRVVGSVLNYVDENYNKLYGKQRGYTEDITTVREWRKRGVARALIARSMRMFEEMSMTEVALSVDAHNPNGALQLYESLGYRVTASAATWRKAMDDCADKGSGGRGH